MTPIKGMEFETAWTKEDHKTPLVYRVHKVTPEHVEFYDIDEGARKIRWTTLGHFCGRFVTKVIHTPEAQS